MTASATMAKQDTSTSAAPGTRRINVVLTQQQYDTLEKLANMQQISLSDALRQALNISDLVVSANADPDTKILLQKGEKTQELKIVR